VSWYLFRSEDSGPWYTTTAVSCCSVPPPPASAASRPPDSCSRLLLPCPADLRLADSCSRPPIPPDPAGLRLPRSPPPPPLWRWLAPVDTNCTVMDCGSGFLLSFDFFKRKTDNIAKRLGQLSHAIVKHNALLKLQAPVKFPCL
jgi:hypothetical protein